MKRSLSFSKNVMSVIKNHASARGLTQERLSRDLQVSLPTLKRWFAGKAVTLENMKRIADLVGVSLIDIASGVEETGSPFFEYTSEQEARFVEDPALLAFFDQLVRGFTPVRIRKKYALSGLRLERYLRQLEKMGLVDWLPGNKVTLKKRGEPHWRKNGALAVKFRPAIAEAFLAGDKKHFEKFLLQDYLPEDRLKIERKLQEIVELATQSHSRATLSPQTSVSGGLFVALKDFRWSLDDYLKS